MMFALLRGRPSLETTRPLIVPTVTVSLASGFGGRTAGDAATVGAGVAGVGVAAGRVCDWTWAANMSGASNIPSDAKNNAPCNGPNNAPNKANKVVGARRKIKRLVTVAAQFGLSSVFNSHLLSLRRG